MASAEFGGICPVTRCAKHMLNGARAAARPAIAAKFQPKRYTIAQGCPGSSRRRGASGAGGGRAESACWCSQKNGSLAMRRSGRVALGGYPPRAPTDPDVQISRIRLLILRLRCESVETVYDSRRQWITLQ